MTSHKNLTLKIRTFLIAVLSFSLAAVFPAPSSAAYTNDSLLPDGRGYGHFAEFVASTRLVGETVVDNDNFTYMSASSDGETVVAAGYVSNPLVYGVYGWSNPDTDWESRDSFDFVLLGDADGTKTFYFTKISADGSTVVARSDDGIYIWEKPIGGWSGEILPTVVQGNQLSNPNYSIGFYKVGWAYSNNIEIAGDGSFLALGASFSWSLETPVIVLNRPGSSWAGFDTATTGYVRIEAPVVEAANSWGAKMSVNPLANEIAIKYKKDQVFIYDNLGTLVEDDFIVDPDLLTANPTVTFNNAFALVGDTLVISPNIANSQVLKEVYIYERTTGTWDTANPTIWNATGLFNSDQNNLSGDVFVLPDEQTIVINAISNGSYILENGSSGWESITGRANQTYYTSTAAYYETDGDVVLGGVSGATPKLSHPAEKPPALVDLVLTSTSVSWNNTMVPAIQVDYSYDPDYTDAIWYDAYIKLDGLSNAISLAGPGDAFYNTNAGMLVAGQTYNVCVYPYATNSANGLMGDPVCQDLKPGAPTKPTINSLTPFDGGLSVSIYPFAGAPTASPVTGYEYSIDDGVSWQALSYVDFKYKITGLTNGTAVDVIIRAKNSVGNGPASDPVTGTPSAPTAATNVVATAGNGSAQVSFTPGTGASYHTVVANPGGRSCNVYSPNTSCTVSALTNGTAYTFTVEAYDDDDNLLTTSSASNSVTPTSGGGGGSVPGAPTGVSASAGNAQATVSWTAVSGATGYTVTSSPGSLTCTTGSTSCTVTGLTNGTAYTFSVVATNNSGPGPASSASASVTPSASGSAPNAPSGVTASGGNGRATVSWPAVSGATEYEVTSNPGGFTCTTSNTSCIVTGLTNGTAYTFTVVASNSYGSSAASGASSAVTPAASSGGGNSSGGFANDPKLEFVPPTSPVEPGTAFASSGGKKVKAEQKKFGSSNSVKVEIGGKNPSTTAVSAVVGGSNSPLPLRNVNGRKSLTPEERSELKIKMGGYKKGSQVQVYVNNLENDDVTFLGYARVRDDGTVVKKLRLPSNLTSGQYNIQINGYGAKTDKVRINKLSIGANLIEKALDRVYFEADSSKLNTATTAGIGSVIEDLREAELVYIYSFTTGNPAAAFKAANDKLANDRAGKVRRYLIANGVDADRIVVTIVGAVLPRDTSKPWQNRRVDLYVDRQIVG
jgi:outer membrane protein OmpA-like peptidoglycan-associated protein